MRFLWEGTQIARKGRASSCGVEMLAPRQPGDHVSCVFWCGILSIIGGVMLGVSCDPLLKVTCPATRYTALPESRAVAEYMRGHKYPTRVLEYEGKTTRCNVSGSQQPVGTTSALYRLSDGTCTYPPGSNEVRTARAGLGILLLVAVGAVRHLLVDDTNFPCAFDELMKLLGGAFGALGFMMYMMSGCNETLRPACTEDRHKGALGILDSISLTARHDAGAARFWVHAWSRYCDVLVHDPEDLHQFSNATTQMVWASGWNTCSVAPSHRDVYFTRIGFALMLAAAVTMAWGCVHGACRPQRVDGVAPVLAPVGPAIVDDPIPTPVSAQPTPQPTPPTPAPVVWKCEPGSVSPVGVDVACGSQVSGT